MEYLIWLGDALKYIQDHGGLLIIGLLAFMYIERVDKHAKDRDANHETYYHNLELKQNRDGAQ